ncbi:MAG: hypothetical protein WCO44_06300 [Bacteroidota bacterium]
MDFGGLKREHADVICFWRECLCIPADSRYKFPREDIAGLWRIFLVPPSPKRVDPFASGLQIILILGQSSAGVNDVTISLNCITTHPLQLLTFATLNKNQKKSAGIARFHKATGL